MSVSRLFDTAIGDRAVQLPTPASGATQLPGVPANQPALVAIVGTVSSDPSSAQDSSQGYQPGSMVLNTTAGQLRFWSCRDATVGNAKWVFEGADYANGGTNPSSEITQFGGAATAQMAEEGNINRQISATGVQPTGTGADYILGMYQLPAGALDQLGRGINIMACGSAGQNTNTKVLKLWWNATGSVGGIIGGGTTIASLTLNTSAGGAGWQLAANVFKYGAAGANTQIALHEASQGGSVVGTLISPSLLTASEAGAINIAVTGLAGTVPTDVVFAFLEVNAMN